MAYRKRNFRKTAIRKRSFRKARSARKFNRITRQLRPPTKFAAETVAGAAISTTYSIWQLSDSVAQGTTSTSRLGEKVLVKGLRLTWNATGVDATNIMRIILLAPKNIGIAMPGSLTVDSLIDKRFYNIYKDFRIKLVATAGASDVQKIGKFYIKLNQIVHYFGAAATDYKTGKQFWLCAVSDSPGAAHPTFSYNSTFMYSDCV